MLEFFSIRPEDGVALDVSNLLTNLDKLHTVVRLPGEIYAIFESKLIPEYVYVICGNVEQAKRLQKWTSAGNTLDRFIGSIAVLEVTSGYILVYQPAPRDVLQQVAMLLLPILKRQSCRIFSEYGEETSSYIGRPECLFE